MQDQFTTAHIIIAGASLSIVVFAALVLTLFRRVVDTNEVHIVQRQKTTTSYGKGTNNGNVYYEWPSAIPYLGVQRTVLPVSVFDLDLSDYEAYDAGRLPFVVDVKAFFRIDNSDVAANRVANFEELKNQLTAIVQGAVRVTLATNDIETILQGRSAFGEQFTKEVQEQLANWGVCTVKNIELMDIRDSGESKVIANIMAKKKSHIEMESRTEVANNHKQAEIAEINAKRETDLQAQAAKQAVGLRTIEADREIALQEEAKTQTIKEQQKVTRAKEMAVLEVERTREAEIARAAELVKVDEQRQATIIRAEAALAAKQREAEGISAEGRARAEAEKAMQLAPVEAQIALAQEIGANESYQNYLVTIERVKATQAVGLAQASALMKADVKIIANTGSDGVGSGLENAMDLFSARGGTKIASMVEAIAQTENGKSLVDRVIGSKPTHPARS